eukprot:scaffold2298_cov21-Tisochrysis_lutea.AAC.7
MLSSYTEQGTLALEFPMGPAGFVLPLAIFAATLTSLRIGFGAAGARAAPADDWVGECTCFVMCASCCCSTLGLGRQLRVLLPQ